MTRTMQRGMSGEDIRLLHAVLNFHLPLPSEQLPTEGPNALLFGPRTEAKVKEFQDINQIDAGSPDFKDGIVGPDTLAVLQSGAQIVFRLVLDPSEAPTPRPLPLPFPQPLPLPSPFPELPKLKTPLLSPPIPQPPIIPAPRLHLDNVQVAAGASHTINFTRRNTDSMFIQNQYTFLWKSKGPHTEISVGSVNLFSLNSNKNGNDIQIFGQITRAQIPIWGNLTASFFAQMAAQNLLMLKAFNPVIGFGAGAQITWEIIENRFSIAAQGMPLMNLLREDDHFKVLTGFQGAGFAIFNFDAGPR